MPCTLVALHIEFRDQKGEGGGRSGRRSGWLERKLPGGSSTESLYALSDDMFSFVAVSLAEILTRY